MSMKYNTPVKLYNATVYTCMCMYLSYHMADTHVHMLYSLLEALSYDISETIFFSNYQSRPLLNGRSRSCCSTIISCYSDVYILIHVSII